jgi:anaerobic magnesium-protoporphyrin IX monomethyl ester cyclase
LVVFGYMDNIDLIFISQSEIVNYDLYGKLPLERLEAYKNLIYPRMVYYKGAFRSHYDIINHMRAGEFWTQATPQSRRKLLSIWNLPGFVGPHIANYLKEFNINTHIVNNFDAELDILAEVYEHCTPKPLVAISTTFHLNYAEITRMIKALQRKFPQGLSIVLGGAFVNGAMYKNDPGPLSAVMKRLGIDFAVHSFNSEVDLRDLLLARKTNKPYASVNNLIYRMGSNGETSFGSTSLVWNNPLVKEVPDHWDELDMPFLNHTIQIRTASGCPFSCSFCSYPETAGGHFASPIEMAEKQIQSVLRRPNINKIIFLDDTFNVPLRRFKDLCRMFCKYNFEWFSFLRVQYVDEEVVQLMKDSGCRGVYLGVESANDQVLKNMNKRASRAEFERGIKLLNKYDISMMVAFVVGFPGETEQTIRDNQDFVESNNIQFTR